MRVATEALENCPMLFQMELNHDPHMTDEPTEPASFFSLIGGAWIVKRVREDPLEPTPRFPPSSPTLDPVPQFDPSELVAALRLV